MGVLTKKSTYREKMETAMAVFKAKCLIPQKPSSYEEAAAALRGTCYLDDRHLEIAFSAMLYYGQRSVIAGEKDPIGKAIAMAEKAHKGR